MRWARKSSEKTARDRSPHRLAGIIRLVVAPLFHELGECVVAALGQHDAHGGQQIAGAVLAGKALALETEGAPGVGGGGDRELDRAVEGGHAYFRPEYRFIERDRQLEPQV